MSDAVIYSNARIVTLDPARPWAGSLRFASGRITHVLDAGSPRGLSGRVVDLGGAVVLPGLVDAHLHLPGVGSTEVDLAGVRSAEAAAARVRAAAVDTPPGAWIRGRGWDQNLWAGGAFPSHAFLDAAAPANPVWLSRVDGHAVWLNAQALRLAGVGPATPAPAGGEILRDAAGAPTGVLVDQAMEVARAALPPPSASELRADLARAFDRLAALGLTGAHDMGTTPEMLAVLEEMEREGALTLRVTAYLHGDEAALAPILAAPPRRSGRLRVVGVKLYADGALGSHGAALLAPYSDRPETSGLLLVPPEALAARARRVAAAGWQLAIHAIGDRGNRVALDAVEAARAVRPARHRVEHAQILAPEDVGRFAALDCVASMQPLHATGDMGWAAARLGEARLRGAYAWRTLRAHGAILALGSDAPVADPNPFFGLHAAVTRRDAANAPDGGWRPEEALTPEEALRAFTRGAALAAGDTDLGVVREGALADLTVVDKGPLATEPLALRSLRALRTVVAGREVFVADDAP